MRSQFLSPKRRIAAQKLGASQFLQVAPAVTDEVENESGTFLVELAIAIGSAAAVSIPMYLD
jgi:hypothetical protein